MDFFFFRVGVWVSRFVLGFVCFGVGWVFFNLGFSFARPFFFSELA